MITILITLGICILLVIGMIIRFIYADKKQNEIVKRMKDIIDGMEEMINKDEEKL